MLRQRVESRRYVIKQYVKSRRSIHGGQSNLAATYYSGQSFEIAASQIQYLLSGSFANKEIVK
jgi:hypothetical protein